MNLIDVIERGAIRLHVLDCGCDDECGNILLLANVAPGELWLCCYIGPPSVTFQEQVAAIFADPYTLMHGISLVGARRERLVGDKLECIRQINAWLASPDWMSRVPIEMVNRVREHVWGDAFVAVPAALRMLDRYLPDIEEGPVPAPTMELLIERQMRVAYPPEKRSMS